ncbi:MAG: type II secretion system F family protein [Verrucomicrobiales bacterium]|nr:type II secretion system F family protein [Verrucomicrobiales bacterium]
MLKKVKVTNVNTGRAIVTLVDTDTHEKALIGCGMAQNEVADIQDITGVDESIHRMTTTQGGVDDRAQLFSGLGRCLERNISMTKSLALQVNRMKSARYKGIIAELITAISSGEKISDAMLKFPDVFPDDVLSLVIAGEESGQLARVCKRIGSAQKKSSKIIKKLKSGLIYPAVVIVMGVGVVIAMSFSLVPAMSNLFKQFGADLPLGTRSLIWLSNLLLKQPWLAAAPFIGLYFFFKNFGAITAIPWVQNLILKLPIVGGLVRKSAAAVSFRTLAMLVESNVRLTAALEITSRASWHRWYREFFARLKDHIAIGRTMHEGFLIESHWLGPDGRNICGMIELASETGTGTELLAEIADDYEEELENLAQQIDKLIEPLTMIILGVLVGFLIYAIYGPIFSLGDVILGKKKA